MAEQQGDNLATNAKAEPRQLPLQPWAFDAYQASQYRKQSILSLAKHYGVDWETVKRNVEKVHLVIQSMEASDVIQARDRYVGALKHTLGCLWQEYAKASEDNTRLGLLKAIASTEEQIAAAEGVVTKRQAEDVTVEINDSPREDLLRRVDSLAARRRADRDTGEPE